MLRKTLALLALGIAVALLGCRGKSGSSSQGTETIKVELSDVQVKITGLDTFHCEVKYRILEGRARPDVEYQCELEMGVVYTVAKVMGKDLKPEGQFQYDNKLFGDHRSYTIKMVGQPTPGASWYQTVSNELRGTLQPMLVK